MNGGLTIGIGSSVVEELLLLQLIKVKAVTIEIINGCKDDLGLFIFASARLTNLCLEDYILEI